MTTTLNGKRIMQFQFTLAAPEGNDWRNAAWLQMLAGFAAMQDWFGQSGKCKKAQLVEQARLVACEAGEYGLNLKVETADSKVKQVTWQMEWIDAIDFAARFADMKGKVIQMDLMPQASAA